MKGVIYARYSSDNQREESIEGQLRECKDYAERNGITILGTYIDRALSAKTDNRPEFQKMIKDSAKGLFDVVLVWKLDRFARNRYDSARYKNLLKKNGVKVISARENISEGSEGIILEAMLEGYAEYYSAELSEKVIRGLTDNALKCKYNGGTVPMGYYIDEQQFYQIDPKTAPVVLEMFTKYSEGATMQELVNLLNSRGMRSIRGGKITLNIMNHLLKNRRYMGEYSYRDVVKEDGIPAIVPKELFERVQERLAKNKKAPARHKAEDDYLLTTKLYCGKCGSFMVGESGTSHTMKVHRYYRCVNTKKKKLCDKKAVKKDWIEDLVVNYTMKAIMNDEVMERLIDTLMELQKKESTDLPLLKKQLAETEKGINNMLNAIQAGISVVFRSHLTGEGLSDNENITAVFDGPIVLAAIGEEGKHYRLDGRSMEEALTPFVEHTYEAYPWQQSSYRSYSDGTETLFLPLYAVTDEMYTIYVEK